MRKWVNVAAIRPRSFDDNSILGCEPSSITNIAPLEGEACVGDATCGRKCICEPKSVSVSGEEEEFGARFYLCGRTETESCDALGDDFQDHLLDGELLGPNVAHDLSRL